MIFLAWSNLFLIEIYPFLSVTHCNFKLKYLINTDYKRFLNSNKNNLCNGDGNGHGYGRE